MLHTCERVKENEYRVVGHVLEAAHIDRSRLIKELFEGKQKKEKKSKTLKRKVKAF